MPRLDGSYPSLGVEYVPSIDFDAQVLPQVECDFSVMTASQALEGGATPITSNGSRGLDPSAFIDISDGLVGGSYAYLNGGTVYNFTDDDPCAFTCAGLIVRSGGSGIRVRYRPRNLQGVDEYIELRMLNGSDDGYLARLKNDGTVAICLVSGGNAVTLRSISTSTSSENDFSFIWDGGSRFKASWGDSFTAEVDDTFDVKGFTLSVVLSNARITSFLAGVTAGASGFDVTAPDREAIYANALFWDGVDFPWPIEGATPVAGADDSVFSGFMTACSGASLIPVVTLAYCPPEYVVVDATPGGAPDPAVATTLSYGWADILDNHPNINDFIVWKDNYGMRCGVDSGSSSAWATPGCTGDEWDYPRYADLYLKAHTVFTETKPGVRLYGPNCHLAARSEGYDASYGGCTVDSRDIDFLQAFLDDLNAASPPFTAAGIAVSGDFTIIEWGKIIPYLKTMCAGYPLVITSPPRQATPVQADVEAYFVAGNDDLDAGDILFGDFTGLTFNSPRTTLTYYDWVFSATLNVPYEMKNAKLKVAAISDKILLNPGVRITNDAATSYVLADELPSGNGYLLLGNLQEGTYSISIFGDKGEAGTATLRIGIYSDNFDVLILADTKFLGA